MNLPKLNELDVNGKKVIVRADLDSPGENSVRLQSLLPTLQYLLKNKAKVIIIGHRGRPDGVKDEDLSLREAGRELSDLLGKEVKFVDQMVGERASEEIRNLKTEEILILENLRFDNREEENDEEFAKILASYGEMFVNEAFGVSHRAHASVVGIPEFLPHAAGFRFAEEVENLNRVLDNPARPVVIVISGVKKGKLDYIEKFKEFADKILVGGRLPEHLSEDLKDSKLVVARLLPDKEDITVRSIEKFEMEIAKAKTIMVSGPVGKFEDEGHKQGTQRIFEAIANSDAFKVAGGGETLRAIGMLGFREQFDWISVGGGAMLEYLAQGTLPGIDALLN